MITIFCSSPVPPGQRELPMAVQNWSQEMDFLYGHTPVSENSSGFPGYPHRLPESRCVEDSDKTPSEEWFYLSSSVHRPQSWRHPDPHTALSEMQAHVLDQQNSTSTAPFFTQQKQILHFCRPALGRSAQFISYIPKEIILIRIIS